MSLSNCISEVVVKAAHGAWTLSTELFKRHTRRAFREWMAD